MTTGGEDRTTAGQEADGRLARARLCVLIEGGTEPAPFERLVGGLFGAGVPMIQIRDKRLPDAELEDRCRRAVAAALRFDPASPPLVVVNDRVAVAAAAGADGVHLGATDMPLPEARHRLGPQAVIGRTAHTLDEARAAVGDGADYVGIGPCYPSVTKTFAAHAPRAFLTAAARLPRPAFAIGGITVARLADLAECGIVRVAVAAAVTAAADPAHAARELLTALAAADDR